MCSFRIYEYDTDYNFSKRSSQCPDIHIYRYVPGAGKSFDIPRYTYIHEYVDMTYRKGVINSSCI